MAALLDLPVGVAAGGRHHAHVVVVGVAGEVHDDVVVLAEEAGELIGGQGVGLSHAAQARAVAQAGATVMRDDDRPLAIGLGVVEGIA